MNKTSKFTTEQIEERIQKIFPSWQYSILEFNGYKSKMIIKCNQCGKEIMLKKAEDLFRKVNPCKCSKIFKNYSEKINFLSNEFNFTILKEGNGKNKYIIKCNSCNTIMNRALVSILNTPWHCDKCNNFGKGRLVYSKEDIQDKLNKEFNFEYELLEYSGNTNKALLRHSCGKIFTIRCLNDLFKKKNRGCPICYQFKSVGEQAIERYLEEHNIDFIPQKTFSPLNKSKYRFDFFIPKYNLAIEYQGEQHYKNNTCFKDTLENIQKRDEIKREYCLNNGIHLKEIKYTELKNIVHILDSMFNDYLK